MIEKNKIYKKQRLQHEITKVIVFLMPIFRTGTNRSSSGQRKYGESLELCMYKSLKTVPRK